MKTNRELAAEYTANQVRCETLAKYTTIVNAKNKLTTRHRRRLVAEAKAWKLKAKVATENAIHDEYGFPRKDSK